MLIIGVDEAGYGPMLGPLVVGGFSLRVPDGLSEEEIGATLLAALDEAAKDDPLRPVIDDSKRVLAAADGWRRLEHTVLAFAGLLRPYDCLSGMCFVQNYQAFQPWQHIQRLEVDTETADAAMDLRDALQRALADRGFELGRLYASVRHVGSFNFDLGNDRSKGDLLFDDHATIFENLLERAEAAESVLAVFDRHGGRMRYQPQLSRYWPARFAWTVREDRERSDYRADFDGRSVRLSFRVKADATAPWVGLASMVAKYLRERAMREFNAYFASVGCDVRPTAGYVEDARRWLRETEQVRRSLGVDDFHLIRRR